MAGKFAKGTKFKATIGAVLTDIGNLTSIGGLDLSADDIDVTEHDSSDDYREFIAGLKDGGAVSLEGNFVTVAGLQPLKTLFDSGNVVAMEIVFPDTLGKWAFSGYINALSTDQPMDDKISFSCSVKVTGKPVLS